MEYIIIMRESEINSLSALHNETIRPFFGIQWKPSRRKSNIIFGYKDKRSEHTSFFVCTQKAIKSKSLFSDGRAHRCGIMLA